MAATKIINLPSDVYEFVQKSATNDGCEKPSLWLADFLRDFGLDCDDIKILIRIPQEVQSDRKKCEDFLAQKLRALIGQLFPEGA
jgi:hypothetical protein